MADPTFTKTVAVLDTVNVAKLFNIQAFVLGNSAMANATADALGPNTHTETLTTTTSVWNVGSASVSESVSASNQFHLFQLLT
jgi:hypothetical protein